MAEVYKMQETGLHVLDMVEMDNLVPELPEHVVTAIGRRVVRDYDTDLSSMSDWLEVNDEAMKLVRQIHEKKSFPWDGAANTKLPLVLNAAIKFGAEAYGELIKGDQLVKAQIFGQKTPEKDQRAQRITARMNYQYFHEMPEWESDHDKLILAYAISGTAHKKYVFNSESGKVDCHLRLSGLVINDASRSTSEAPRITDELWLFGWEAEERYRNETWSRAGIHEQNEDDNFAEEDNLQLYLEQIRREDLDGDGYPEPYIVTVHKTTSKVVRITPNYTEETLFFPKGEAETAIEEGRKPDVRKIDAQKGRVRYVKYDFIPNFDGGYWGFGWGRLLGPLNDNCNSLVNQLIDAGTLANTQGGWISQNLRSANGDNSFSPGEWKRVNAFGGVLKDSILPLPVREPSGTLFSLLGLLMETLKELSSVTAVMSGEQPRANMAASSVMALIEQGKKTFNSIYKRHWRGMKNEFLALFDMNYLYEDPQTYQLFTDSPADPQKDFERFGMDVFPTASPEFSSKVQRMAEAEALLPLAQDPRVNGAMILRKYVDGVLENPEESAAMVPEEPSLTPQQVMEEVQIKVQEAMGQLDVQAKQLDLQSAQIRLLVEQTKAERDQVRLPAEFQREILKNQGQELKNEEQLFKVAKAEAEAINARESDRRADT